MRDAIPMLAAPHWIPGGNRADRGRLAVRFQAGGRRQLQLAAAAKVGRWARSGKIRRPHAFSTLWVYLKRATNYIQVQAPYADMPIVLLLGSHEMEA